MQRYGIISEEMLEQTSTNQGEGPYTHIFLQGGVSGFPAGVTANSWEHGGADRPHFIIVGEVACLCRYLTRISPPPQRRLAYECVKPDSGWGWLVATGILLVLLGCMAHFHVLSATLTSVISAGIMMLLIIVAGRLAPQTYAAPVQSHS